MGEFERPVRFLSSSQDETETIGRNVGAFLLTKGGDAVLCFYGDLGAGKTSFIRGLATAFGIPGRDIGSASFIIVAEYETSPPFYHIDLYRVTGEDDLESTGVWDTLESGGIAAVEWAERLPCLPKGAIIVRIDHRRDVTREIIIEGLPEGVLDGKKDSENR